MRQLRADDVRPDVAAVAAFHPELTDEGRQSGHFHNCLGSNPEGSRVRLDYGPSFL